MSVEAGSITVRTVATFLLASWPRRVVLGLILLLPVTVWLLGGFRAAPQETFQVPAGAPVDLGQLTVEPTAFFVSDEVRRSDLEFTDGAVAWLGVLVDLENTTDARLYLNSPTSVGEAFLPQLPEGVLVDQIPSTPDAAVRVADASDGSAALPGVPTQVALLWPVGDPDAIGDQLEMHMTSSEWTYSILQEKDAWIAIGDIWVTELPRTELPESLFEPEDDP